jgi:hypothetical protein
VSDEIQLEQELDGSFVHPGRTWQGRGIAPYTEGSRLLMAQVRDDADGPLFFVYAFLFLHLELARDRKSAIRLAWNKDAFREAVLDFASGFDERQREEAGALVSEIIDEATKSRTSVVPSGQQGSPPGKP